MLLIGAKYYVEQTNTHKPRTNRHFLRISLGYTWSGVVCCCFFFFCCSFLYSLFSILIGLFYLFVLSTLFFFSSSFLRYLMFCLDPNFYKLSPAYTRTLTHRTDRISFFFFFSFAFVNGINWKDEKKGENRTSTKILTVDEKPKRYSQKGSPIFDSMNTRWW